MAGRYKQFLRLLESWPVDETKKGRDLGTYIRKKIAEAFPMGETSTINAEECEKVYLSLKKISDNYYGSKYKRRNTSSATGLTYEQCAGINSTDFLSEYSSSKRLFSWFQKR